MDNYKLLSFCFFLMQRYKRFTPHSNKNYLFLVITLRQDI